MWIGNLQQITRFFTNKGQGFKVKDIQDEKIIMSILFILSKIAELLRYFQFKPLPEIWAVAMMPARLLALQWAL